MIRLLTFWSCLGMACASLAQSAPVYLYFASHNETTDQNFHGLNYSNPADYALMRTYIQRVCDTLLAYDAPYDMMLESNFILGCLKNENAASNPNDLIEWASQQPGFSVQPHNHFKPFGLGANPYNYADLVYLLDSCGLDTAYVMGGFIWRNFTAPVNVNEDWTVWQTPQPGFSFPAARWRPTLLWGGGSPGHIDDFNAYGVWKPAAPTNTGFGQHDPSRTLVNFGGGCNDGFVLWDTSNAYHLAYRIMNFADSVQAHYSTHPDAFFNMKVMMNFRHFPSAGYAEKLGLILRTIRPYIQSGKIQFAGILDTWSAWKALHPEPADYFALTCEESVVLSHVKPLDIITGTDQPLQALVTMSPNPASGVLCFTPEVQEVSLWDIQGRPALRATGALDCLNVSQLYPGWYYGLVDGRPVKLLIQR